MCEGALHVVLKPRFRKDYARCARRGWDITKLDGAMRILASGARMPPEYNDHGLKGGMAAYRECHIGGPHSDWLLVYRKLSGRLILEFVETGTHRELGLGG